MKKILLSLSVIGAVSAVAIGATTSFFSDTETSTGNTFTAGGVDLKVDNTCYYNIQPNGEPNCPSDPNNVTSWSETDLGPTHKFFNFADLKPGDFGEDTISLHVTNNDAWGRYKVTVTSDSDNGCNDPELTAEPTCVADGDGELNNTLTFNIWLDQGVVPGFQCSGQGGGARCETDPQEGDNIWQQGSEPLELQNVDIGFLSSQWFNLSSAILDAYVGVCTQGQCPGITSDGHMVGSITYYLGIGWNLSTSTGNEAQTDSLGADVSFQVEQYRNNPSPFPTP